METKYAFEGENKSLDPGILKTEKMLNIVNKDEY